MLLTKSVLAVLWLVRRGGRPALRWSVRRGPLLLLIAGAIYLLLVLRAAATLSNLLWAGNALFALALASVGVLGLVATLGGERVRAVTGRFTAGKAKVESLELSVLAPDGTRLAHFYLERPMYVVGRAPECDVRIQEPNVSRRHCLIVRRGGRYRVEELGSTYGTTLNGRKLPAEGVALRRGDVIGFASTAPTATRLLIGPTRSTAGADAAGGGGPSGRGGTSGGGTS
jgi:hypothetical protein